MKSDFLLKIEHESGEVSSFEFHTTRAKADKLFFDFAFCLPSSDLVRVSLFLYHRHCPDGVSLNNYHELLNEATRNVP